MFKKLPEWCYLGAELLIHVPDSTGRIWGERATVVQIKRRSIITEVAPGFRFETPISQLHNRR